MGEIISELIERNPQKSPKLENEKRLIFFSDLHIQNSKEGIQTDLGGSSYEMPKNTKKVIRGLNPDYIFGLGDLTAHSESDEWVGYNNWIKNFEAPVFDIFGNHDRNHFPITDNRYGLDYFTKLGRVSDTKVLGLGNNIFILVSEEHNPEEYPFQVTSTIPDKRFDFIEKQLKRYSKTHNIFILTHTPLSGTTAFSDTWAFGYSKDSKYVTEKWMNLLKKYNLTAHISGHVHIDYRWKDANNRGKFIHGSDLNESYPSLYFLNIPCVDIFHGWLGSRSKGINSKAQKFIKDDSKIMNFYLKIEDWGPPIMDIIHNSATSSFLGRSAIYYFDLKEGEESIDMITRWVSGDRDVENYEIKLKHPIKLGKGEIEFLDSDLSIRYKQNLDIIQDYWFKLKAGEKGHGEFSKKYNKRVKIEGIVIEGKNKGNFSVKFKGSEDAGKSWSDWYDNPEDLGEIDAIMLKIEFESLPDKDWYVRDVVIEIAKARSD
jgi:predicted phosphodiesterase